MDLKRKVRNIIGKHFRLFKCESEKEILDNYKKDIDDTSECASLLFTEKGWKWVRVSEVSGQKLFSAERIPSREEIREEYIRMAKEVIGFIKNGSEKGAVGSGRLFVQGYADWPEDNGICPIVLNFYIEP